jgi:Na+/melibiose symporter-like transporter
MTVFSLSSLACIPLWMRVARAIGKHRAYTIGMLIGGASPLAWLLIHPSAMSQIQVVVFAFIVVIVMGAGLACNGFAAASILGDIVDYGTWRTGNPRTGSYFACYLLATKIAVAIGGSIAYMTIGAFGYNARAGAINTPLAIGALLVVFALVPPILKITGALIMYNFPLDARRYGIIRRRLGLGL